MDVETFAKLGSAWPEYLVGYGGEAKLIARIHSNANREKGDEDVLVRALVFDKDRLARLTIRGKSLVNHNREKDEPAYMQEYEQEQVLMYRNVLFEILALPVLDLTLPKGASWSGANMPGLVS